MKNARLLLLLWAALPLAAQTSSIDCGKNIIGVKLPDLDEISSGDTGVLSGTLYTVSEQVRMPAGNPLRCYPQWVRAYRKELPKKPRQQEVDWNPPSSSISDPKPGPTLRAKVGDMVNLTFFNYIDANKFPNADKGDCDETSLYPDLYGTDKTDPAKKVQVGRDTFPNCFAHSVFTNVHFHGTHTSPNTTADNVFITVRPSPRTRPPIGSDPRSFPPVPIVKAEDVKDSFDPFFRQCNAELKTAAGPKMWPLKWSDLSSALQTKLMENVTGREDANNEQIKADGWPQYYAGAYPYCFKLPKRTGPNDSLQMGQAPGTHWYHAHKHGSTTINVLNGMTGVFIIEGDYDKVLREHYKPNFTEKVLVIQQLGSVPPMVTGSLFTGVGGDVNFFVNGKFQPVLQMAGNSVQMWRIANTAGRAGAYFAAPAPDTLQWKQLAIDGVQLAPENYEQRPSDFLIASGNRIDLVVKAPRFNPEGNNKYPVIVYKTVAPTDRPPIKPTAARLKLFTVEVTDQGNLPDQDFIPKGELAPLPKFLDDIEEVDGIKTLTFATSKVNPDKQAGSTPANHTIDGKLFDHTVGPSVDLNDSEEWKVVNETYAPAISHPFHIHINPFQLTEIFDPNEYIPVAGTGTGTVSVKNKQVDVVGTGTAFKTVFQAGDVINIDNGQGGVIKSVDSDTKMTLKDKATADVDGAKYTQMIPQYTIDNTTKRLNQCYLDPEKKSTWVSCVKEPAEKRVWWDVFSIPSGRTFTSSTTTKDIPGYFKMRSRFVDYPGHFVLHCHILAHEDRGMMTIVAVDPPAPPRKSPHSHQ